MLTWRVVLLSAFFIILSVDWFYVWIQAAKSHYSSKIYPSIVSAIGLGVYSLGLFAVNWNEWLCAVWGLKLGWCIFKCLYVVGRNGAGKSAAIICRKIIRRLLCALCGVGVYCGCGLVVYTAFAPSVTSFPLGSRIVYDSRYFCVWVICASGKLGLAS